MPPTSAVYFETIHSVLFPEMPVLVGAMLLLVAILYYVAARLLRTRVNDAKYMFAVKCVLIDQHQGSYDWDTNVDENTHARVRRLLLHEPDLLKIAGSIPRIPAIDKKTLADFEFSRREYEKAGARVARVSMQFLALMSIFSGCLLAFSLFAGLECFWNAQPTARQALIAGALTASGLLFVLLLRTTNRVFELIKNEIMDS